MISLKDIARTCNVSESTVSKALKGLPEIKAATRERIQEVARQYHYQPNANVQTIQTGRSRTIGIAYNNFHDPFAGAIMAGIHRKLHTCGYDSMVICWDMIVADASEVFSRFARRRADGLLVFPMAQLPTPFYINELRNFHSPVILLDQTWPDNEFSFVGSDNRTGAGLAVRHLVERGITAIGMIGSFGISSGRERYEGFCAALQDCGLPIRPEWQVDVSTCLEHGYLAIRRLLEQPDRPLGLVCFNDYLAFEAQAAAADLGLTIPDDLSLIGFGDLFLCTRMRPQLTTIAQHPEDIGCRAAELLLQKIASPEAAAVRQEIRLPVELISRQTVR